MNEYALREQICKIGELMHRQGYIDGNSGNISVRLDGRRVLTTPSGLAKGFMSPEQLIIVDLDGKRIDRPTSENADLRPTSELAMHLECYRQREDVQGVVHAHPPVSVAMTIAGIGFQQCLIPEAVVILGLIPTTPYATPASEENREAIRGLIAHHDVIMLAFHGSLTVGKTVWDAYMKLESLEHTAKILTTVHQLGGAKNPLPADKITKLVDARERLGLLKPGDYEGLMLACGVQPAAQANDELVAQVRAVVRDALLSLQAE